MELEPQIVQALSVAVAAAAMIVLGRGKHLLESQPIRRCASCKRLLRAGGRCPRCG